MFTNPLQHASHVLNLRAAHIRSQHVLIALRFIPIHDIILRPLHKRTHKLTRLTWFLYSHIILDSIILALSSSLSVPSHCSRFRFTRMLWVSKWTGEWLISHIVITALPSVEYVSFQTQTP